MHRVNLLLFLSVILFGCVSGRVESPAYSGFLQQYYAQLQPGTSPSGEPVMRWISPQFNKDAYSQVIISPSQFYPEPKTSDKLYTETLTQILSYLDTDLNQDVSAVIAVVQSASPNAKLNNTLRLQVAISGITTTEKGLQIFKDHAVINVEYKITDAVTDEVMVAGVRKGFGKSLPSTSSAITLDDLTPVMDLWSQDAASFFTNIKK
jgi:hypothetical protein